MPSPSLRPCHPHWSVTPSQTHTVARYRSDSHGPRAAVGSFAQTMAGAAAGAGAEAVERAHGLYRGSMREHADLLSFVRDDSPGPPVACRHECICSGNELPFMAASTRPILGGDKVPYPRRCRTGRPPTDTLATSHGRAYDPGLSFGNSRFTTEETVSQQADRDVYWLLQNILLTADTTR